MSDCPSLYRPLQGNFTVAYFGNDLDDPENNGFMVCCTRCDWSGFFEDHTDDSNLVYELRQHVQDRHAEGKQDPYATIILEDPRTTACPAVDPAPDHRMRSPRSPAGSLGLDDGL